MQLDEETRLLFAYVGPGLHMEAMEAEWRTLLAQKGENPKDPRRHFLGFAHRRWWRLHPHTPHDKGPIFVTTLKGLRRAGRKPRA